MLGAMRRATGFLLGLLLALAGAGTAGAAPPRAPDELAIGITQFPSTLNPLIDAMTAKVYVLAMVRRPFTRYGAYSNYMADDEPLSGVMRAFAENFPRLQSLKDIYDPGNLFRNNQNIPPST